MGHLPNGQALPKFVCEDCKVDNCSGCIDIARALISNVPICGCGRKDHNICLQRAIFASSVDAELTLTAKKAIDRYNRGSQVRNLTTLFFVLKPALSLTEIVSADKLPDKLPTSQL